jgi:hypothetical protein
MSYVDDGELAWLPHEVTLTRPELLELLPALRALVNAVDADTPAFAHVVTIATVLGEALDRADGQSDREDES